MRIIIVTGEYPPQPGGVSDYTQNLARGLVAKGHEVHVWAPPSDGVSVAEPGVLVHRLGGVFRLRDLVVLGRAMINSPSSTRIFVQYVPHSFGWKAMNMPFCFLLYMQRRNIWIMFHEVAFPFRRFQPFRHNFLAAVNHIMAAIVVSAAEKRFISIPAWGTLLRKIAPWVGPMEWLPVPSNLPTSVDLEEVRAIRGEISPSEGTIVIGHFGTYGTEIGSLLGAVVPVLLEKDFRRVFLLIGRGSTSFAEKFIREHPHLEERIHVAANLPADRAAAYLAACDCLVQPYVDGVSSRRTTLMAGLALGLPIATTEGRLTEPIWASHRAVAMADASSPDDLVEKVESLIDDPNLLDELRLRARRLYEEKFSLQHTIELITK